MSRLASPLAFVIILAASLVHGAPHANAAAGDVYSISGVVLSDAGAPLEGAEVYGYSYDDRAGQSQDKAITDADGHWALKLGQGNASVSASYPKWNGANAYDAFYIAGDEKDIKLVITAPPPRTAVIEGIVRGVDGSPLADVTVTLDQACCMYATSGEATPTPSTPTTAESTAPSEGKASAIVARPCCYNGDSQKTTTGKDGAYTFTAYGGPHAINAFLTGYAQATIQVELKDKETVKQDIKMEKPPKATATLHGRVLDAKTGAPIANAGVSLSNLEWSRYAYATTGKDGAYTFTTLPGWSQITVYVNGYPEIMMDSAIASPDRIQPPSIQYYQWIEMTKLVEGDNPLDVKLEPRPEPTIAVIGYAVDPDAKTGVAGATITISNQDTGDWGTATTDKTGSFKIMARPGHFIVNAYAPGHLGGASMFTIVDGAATKRVDVTLPAGETRYAPCDPTEDASAGCCCYGGPYPMPMMAKESMVASDSSPTASSSAPNAGSPGATSNDTLATGASKSTGPDTTRAAAYSGSGGGLPPYDAQAASASQGSGGANDTPTKMVPSIGLAGALAGLAAVAALLARRK